jgi:hypothetical protein
MRIGSIVVHCFEFDAMVEFWQAALGYVPRDPASDGERRRARRNWIHLDLYTTDQEGEIARLPAPTYPARSMRGIDAEGHRA